MDDAVALTAFSVCTAVVNALQTGHIQFADRGAAPAVESGGGGAGAGAGRAAALACRAGHSQAHTLVLVNAVLLFLSGLCSTLGISPLLACMALGAGYVNLGGEKRLFKRMDKFSPPFLLLFFALSGLRLNIPSLATAGVIGVAYFFVPRRQIRGASSGGRCAAPTRPSSNIWASLTPQAGVSSVLPCWANACCLRPKARCWPPSSFLRCTV
ncbi:MAG: cation:proton antiporter [Ruthenibacterium lactatiformans]